MNRWRGVIQAVQTHGHMSLIALDAYGNSMSSIVVDTPESADYLKAGTEVDVLFKETEVFLADSRIGNASPRNRISGEVTEVERGELLSKVTLDAKGHKLVSIITTASADELGIDRGSQLLALIKTNEVMIRP